MCSPTTAINNLFPSEFEAAVKEAGIEPVGRPEVSVDSASDDQGAVLTVKVAVKPESSWAHMPV